MVFPGDALGVLGFPGDAGGVDFRADELSGVFFVLGDGGGVWLFPRGFLDVCVSTAFALFTFSLCRS